MHYAIDTHCHLTIIESRKRELILQRAHDAGVKKMITVACNADEIGQCLDFVKDRENLWTSAGVHPTELGKNMENELEIVSKASQDPKVVAIGEIGLDYYHDTFPREAQADYLERQLKIAGDVKKPAIIHSRGGKFAGENSSVFPDMVNILKKLDFSNAVMHCFSGTMAEAKMYLEMGLMLSFTGIVTYDRNTELREVIKMIPAERIMIETDSPFLPPKNHKGEQNEPAFVIEVAKMIAEVRGISIEEAMDITLRNAERFFGI